MFDITNNDKCKEFTKEKEKTKMITLPVAIKQLNKQLRMEEYLVATFGNDRTFLGKCFLLPEIEFFVIHS